MLLLMKRRERPNGPVSSAPKPIIREREDNPGRDGRTRRRRQPQDTESSASEDEVSQEDTSDSEDEELSMLTSRIRYTDSPMDDDDLESSSASGSESKFSGDDDASETAYRPYRPTREDYYTDSEYYSTEEDDWDDQRQEMQQKMQRMYFSTTKKKKGFKGVRSIEIQKKELDHGDLSVKKIEAGKKLNAVWQSIIQRYEGIGEDEQGDLVNLESMTIEENTGHIATLKAADRTMIWDDFFGDGSDHEHDTKKDPLNLLEPLTPKKTRRSDVGLRPSLGSYRTPSKTRLDTKTAEIPTPTSLTRKERWYAGQDHGTTSRHTQHTSRSPFYSDDEVQQSDSESMSFTKKHQYDPLSLLSFEKLTPRRTQQTGDDAGSPTPMRRSGDTLHKPVSSETPFSVHSSPLVSLIPQRSEPRYDHEVPEAQRQSVLAQVKREEPEVIVIDSDSDAESDEIERKRKIGVDPLNVLISKRQRTDLSSTLLSKRMSM